MVLIVALLALDCPVQAHLVEQPLDLGQVQADEIRVKRQGGIMAGERC